MQIRSNRLGVGRESGVAADRHLGQDGCDAPGGSKVAFSTIRASAKRLENMNTEKGLACRFR
jgi:hypothetical protein